MRGIAANFASNSRLIGEKVRKRIRFPAYLLKEAFDQVFSFLCVTGTFFPMFLQIFSTFILADSFSRFVFRYS